jgi:hypothetical protein
MLALSLQMLAKGERIEPVQAPATQQQAQGTSPLLAVR